MRQRSGDVDPAAGRQAKLSRSRGEADDGPRTRDLRLGKPTLYQLSYVRVPGSVSAVSPPGEGVHLPLRWTVKRLLRPLPLVVVIGTIALVSLLAYGLASGGSKRTLDDAVARGDPPAAPKLDLPPLKGAPAGKALNAYRGKVVVLNVWASWCTPCRDESPLLERWHRRITQKGGTVLGVDVQDIDTDARNFIREYKLTYPHVRDKEGDNVRSEYGVVGYPETFVIDRQGRVAALQRGPVDDKFMEQAVEPLLREDPQ